jgi:hypothetical protein
LREIELRPSNQLRFSVTSPDGVTVSDLDAEALRDLMRRMES